MAERTFKIFAPLAFFEKADAPEGQRRRIAGVVTTESRDREGEVILQRGLDFNEFKEYGFWNDNHSKATDGVLGEPELVKMFKKGDKLPDGNVAASNCHWAEGFLYHDDPLADRIWQKGLAIQKSGGKRRLGFSIEGVIQKRTGHDNKTIAQAKVRNVAITNCPVNTDTYLNALEKAIKDAEKEVEEEEKALTSGSASGRALSPQSLEMDKPKLRPKGLTKSEAVAWVVDKFPQMKSASAEKLVMTTFALRDKGLL